VKNITDTAKIAVSNICIQHNTGFYNRCERAHNKQDTYMRSTDTNTPNCKEMDMNMTWTLD